MRGKMEREAREMRKMHFERNDRIVRKMNVGDIRFVFYQMRMQENLVPSATLWNGMAFAEFALHYILQNQQRTRIKRSRNKKITSTDNSDDLGEVNKKNIWNG
jgi:hypothetical protein